jgi:hypothetical protein
MMTPAKAIPQRSVLGDWAGTAWIRLESGMVLSDRPEMIQEPTLFVKHIFG